MDKTMKIFGTLLKRSYKLHSRSVSVELMTISCFLCPSSVIDLYDISADELLALEDETQAEILIFNDTLNYNRTQERSLLAFAVIFESTSMLTNKLRYKIRTSKEQLRHKDTRFVYPKEYNVPDVTLEGIAIYMV
jgi:hypothetical protein